MEFVLNFQKDLCGAIRNKRNVSAELDRIAIALLGMKKNSLACKLLGSAPLRLRKIAFAVFQPRGFPSPFVLFPAAVKVTDK